MLTYNLFAMYNGMVCVTKVTYVPIQDQQLQIAVPKWVTTVVTVPGTNKSCASCPVQCSG